MPGLGVDALTANPLLGRDALAPLVARARAAGAGVFVLVRTSNPGAADLMDLRARRPASRSGSGSPAGRRTRRAGPAGLADVGAVTGATAPEHLRGCAS